MAFAAIFAPRIHRLHFDATAAFGDGDVDEAEHFPGVVGGAAVRSLHNFQGRLIAADGRHPDVAGDVPERKLSIGTELERLRLAIGLRLAVLIAILLV